MLPVVRGDAETARQIVLYSVALVGFTVVPFALGWFGAVYLGQRLGSARSSSGWQCGYGVRSSLPARLRSSTTRCSTSP